MKRLSLLFALAGLLIAMSLIGYFGVRKVAGAIARVSAGDFALIFGWQLLLFTTLGMAWNTIAPGGMFRRPWVLVWARMVRDASANCLPFAQVGGFVFGTRVATLHGMRWSSATASMVADITSEFMAQIVFAFFGLMVLLAKAPNSHLARPLAIGLGIAAMGALGFFLVQKGAAPLFAGLARRIIGRRFPDAHERVVVLQAELALIYAYPWRLVLGFVLHLAGWFGTGMAGWIAFHALDVPIDLEDALAIEALLSAVAAMAFLVPANAGIQEVGYTGLGAIFGVPPEMALAVSLLRRGRDILIGIPILLTWQLVEVRRLKAAPARD